MPPSYKQILFAVTAAQAISMHFQVTVIMQCIITETLSWLHLKLLFSDISYGTKLQLSRNAFCKDLSLYCYCLLQCLNFIDGLYNVELW